MVRHASLFSQLIGFFDRKIFYGLVFKQGHFRGRSCRACTKSPLLLLFPLYGPINPFAVSPLRPL
jgi:hypothetical protein